jgi:DNA replication and repair protein RecF
MPAIQKLSVSSLRNIGALEIRPSPCLNILYGENGSGKTSILEAIYLLGLAKSFRSSQLKPLIQHGKQECSVFGALSSGISLGVSKVNRGSQLVKISGKKAKNIAELASNLPLQLINSDTFEILEGSPKKRRSFIDWGTFHVEHQFFDAWRHGQRALQHRNNLLRNGAKNAELEPWTIELTRHGKKVDLFRGAYVDSYLPVFTEILGKLINLDSLSLEYDRGWDSQLELGDALEDSLGKDLKYGYTSIGPHRADLKIKVGQNYAVDILSRGQQKLLICAMKIAQGQLLKMERGIESLYLIDDLPAELDENNRVKVCSLLESINSQVFITCVERLALENYWTECREKGDEKKLFHVKHGKIALSNSSQ